MNAQTNSALLNRSDSNPATSRHALATRIKHTVSPRRSDGLARQPATARHRVPATGALIDVPFVTSQGCHGGLDMTDLGDTRAHFAMLALLPKNKIA